VRHTELDINYIFGPHPLNHHQSYTGHTGSLRWFFQEPGRPLSLLLTNQAVIFLTSQISVPSTGTASFSTVNLKAEGMPPLTLAYGSLLVGLHQPQHFRKLVSDFFFVTTEWEVWEAKHKEMGGHSSGSCPALENILVWKGSGLILQMKNLRSDGSGYSQCTQISRAGWERALGSASVLLSSLTMAPISFWSFLLPTVGRPSRPPEHFALL
jgi:hypothetical protein